MEKEDTTPGQSEQELEPKQEGTDKPAESGNDPLDSLIDDPKALLAEAKKFRSISQRKGKNNSEAPKVDVPTAPNSQFVTKADLERAATREAKRLVGPEIAAEYDSLVKIPLGGYDPLDAASIAENLKERFVILKARKPVGEKKDGVSDLSVTRVTTGTGTGGNNETKPDKKNPPNFSLPKKPTDWYPKQA